MGGFETYIVDRRSPALSRSVLRASVGPTAENAPDDLRIIYRTLSEAGLLGKDTAPDLAREAIFRAIRHAQRSISDKALAGSPHADDVIPGDLTERTIRRAVSEGRFQRSHRNISETAAPRAPRSLLSGGMNRALGKTDDASPADMLAQRFRRALLPSISMQTFQANRRLVEALTKEGQIPGLADLLAETLSGGAKQGYTDIRDFMDALHRSQPQISEHLAANVALRLDGKPARRFRKLCLGQPPAKADFD